MLSKPVNSDIRLEMFSVSDSMHRVDKRIGGTTPLKHVNLDRKAEFGRSKSPLGQGVELVPRSPIAGSTLSGSRLQVAFLFLGKE